MEETFSTTFRITYDYFGEKRFYDLKSNGENIPVTNANRQGGYFSFSLIGYQNLYNYISSIYWKNP